MLIGLASCMRLSSCELLDGKPVQPVWDTLRSRVPAGRTLDGLLLSGDQVYSGYGVWDALGKPQLKMSAQDFLSLMYGQYRGQYEVPQFQALLAVLPQDGGQRRVGLVWDDHDFGYNNAFGTDPRFSVDKRRITRHLFEMFRRALREFEPGKPYPAESTLAQATADTSDRGVDEVLSWPGVKVFLPDQRMHAHSSKADAPRRMQRPADWAQVVSGLQAHSGGWSVLVSGRPYSVSQKGRPDFWQMYEEAADLRAVAAQAGNVVIFCGDLHRNVKPIQHPGLLEVITSGAAQDGDENFGLLDLQSDQADVRLYEKGRNEPQYQASFTRGGLPAVALEAAVLPTPVLEVPSHPFQLDADVMAAPFSTRFLVTNRRMDGDKPTDDATETLRYFTFPGTGLQAHARSLKGWSEVPGPQQFFGLVLRAFQDLQRRDGDARRQLCVFVHGNRKSNEEVIQQYAEVDRLFFNAAGAGSLGVCVAFDWATNDRESIFALKDTYQDNIDRVPAAAALMAPWLEQVRATADLAGASLSILGHSLGNRLVLAALARLQQADLAFPFVEHYIVNAADVPSTLFASDDGAMLRRSCAAITVVWSQRDRTLESAQQSGTLPDFGARMGRHGPAPGSDLTRVSVKELSGPLCHPQDVHSGLFATPWPDASHGMYVDGYARMLRDSRWA